ncbi:hypothetical protein SAMN04489712_101493 [Thermomonospora echinospora]|uniref:Uncharacterized protein n=1 Tax=Thermomonospora echinospora TaxID=1992 RepID=A0A1H5T5M2_9ACTN|nr:hypothetical protein [Thermomonospora echinospora]SEF58079.1 hypothetical protein SAMN04489712_101493 [Thermomonospora echinospora]
MRVELTAAVLETDAHAEDVVLLLRYFKEGRHEWAIGPLLVDAVKVFVDRHVPVLAPAYKLLAEQAALRHTAYRTPSDPEPVRLAPDDIKEHVADLRKSAVVMVEDDATDGGFLKVIARVFDAADVLRAVDRGWLVIDHGGGAGGAFRRAEEKRKEFARLPRVAVVVDSDREMPDDPPKHETKISELRAKNVRVHVLRLREIENYIPDKCLYRLPSQQDDPARVKALARLSKEQRAHFDMKNGFGKRSKVHPRQHALFGKLDPELRKDLGRGFGPNVIRCLLNHADALTEEDFRRDVGPDVPGELRAMLAMIREIV